MAALRTGRTLADSTLAGREFTFAVRTVEAEHCYFTFLSASRQVRSSYSTGPAGVQPPVQSTLSGPSSIERLLPENVAHPIADPMGNLHHTPRQRILGRQPLRHRKNVQLRRLEAVHLALRFKATDAAGATDMPPLRRVLRHGAGSVEPVGIAVAHRVIQVWNGG